MNTSGNEIVSQNPAVVKLLTNDCEDQSASNTLVNKTKTPLIRMKYVTLLLLATLSLQFLAENLLSQTNSMVENQNLGSNSSYQSEVLQIMLREADTYALSLGLRETHPLTTNSLTEIYISPPEFANRYGGLGSLRTKSYSYAFGRGKRLAYITRLSSPENSHKSLYDAHKHLAIAPALVNTNAAFLLATQWLEKAFVDVKKLTESNSVSIKPWRILDIVTSKYTVEWLHEGEPVARVILIEPTKELLVLRVEDPEYILRPEIVVKPTGPSGNEVPGKMNMPPTNRDVHPQRRSSEY